MDALYRNFEFSSSEDEVGVSGGSVSSFISLEMYFSDTVTIVPERVSDH